MTGVPDELVQSLAEQEGHDEVRLSLALLFKLTGVEDVHNIGMADICQGPPLLGKQFQGCRVGDVFHRLKSDVPFPLGIVCLINDTHSALSKQFSDVVAPVDRELDHTGR